MKITLPATAAAAAALAAAGLLTIPSAAADTTLGQQGKLVNGDVVQAWTVSNLHQSSDALDYTPKGTLWEATATDEAIAGSVTPIVSNFNARAADGESYRVLYQLATPQGVSPATLQQGSKATGKIYFDVTGAAPVSVVYSDGGETQLVWAPAPAAPAQPATGSGQRVAPAPATSAIAATPTPAAATPPPASIGTPLTTEETPGATPPATQVGSTPAPSAPASPTAATPAPATPVASSPAATPAPAKPVGDVSPVQGASLGTPVQGG